MNRLCPRGSFTFVKSYSRRQRCFILLRYTQPIGSVLCNDWHAGLSYGYSTKAKNYYDVLELTPKATDIQIKSAYYRLSKKYHPDKNPSKESKAMFTEIAEAYETLGNKRLRKIYDSNQTDGFVRESHTMSNASPFSQHKSRRKPPTGRSTIYNFDEFYRQHYGDVRMGKQMRREAYEEAMKERRELVERKNTVIVLILISTVTMLVINMFTLYRSH